MVQTLHYHSKVWEKLYIYIYKKLILLFRKDTLHFTKDFYFK